MLVSFQSKYVKLWGFSVTEVVSQLFFNSCTRVCDAFVDTNGSKLAALHKLISEKELMQIVTKLSHRTMAY